MAANTSVFLDGPALAAPVGVISQLDSPPNYKTASVAGPAISFVLATLLVSMRIYTKKAVVRSVDLADYSILLAFGIFAGYIGAHFDAERYAPGEHQWDVRLRNLSPYLHSAHICSILYGIIIFLIKLSILLQYIQIFMPHHQPRLMYRSTVFLIGLNSVAYLVITILEIWSCNPISKARGSWSTGDHCIHILPATANVCASIVNTASDFVILLLPQFFIWRLNMGVNKKRSVSMVFMIAILACVSSTIRLYYGIVLQYADDKTWYTWLISMWALPEMVFGIFVTCVPVAGVFVHSAGNSKLYKAISSSIEGIRAWGGTRGGQDSSRYVLEDRESNLGVEIREGRIWTDTCPARERGDDVSRDNKPFPACLQSR